MGAKDSKSRAMSETIVAQLNLIGSNYVLTGEHAARLYVYDRSYLNKSDRFYTFELVNNNSASCNSELVKQELSKIRSELKKNNLIQKRTIITSEETESGTRICLKETKEKLYNTKQKKFYTAYNELVSVTIVDYNLEPLSLESGINIVNMPRMMLELNNSLDKMEEERKMLHKVGLGYPDEKFKRYQSYVEEINKSLNLEKKFGDSIHLAICKWCDTNDCSSAKTGKGYIEKFCN